MMPGEALAAGIAAEAATACANCSALQQNLNEYVAALIALKQKIIDTDRLLTEYQQKCNELQLAERENNTLRHQVEQMLQKISPLEECQQELGSLKAELEEKKSSLKIYQQTHLEYARVKEEIVRSDAVKKKLEAKVKKLEEAATKHMQDFRQLKTEKKVLEKELKKAQEKLDDFPKQKCKKELKHAETQSAREDPVANIDKGKIKLLLEELWMCIDSSTGKRQNQENDYILAASVKDRTRTPEKTVKLFTEEVEQNHQKFRKSNGKMPYSHSSPETIGKQNSLTTLQIKVDKEPHRGDHFESKTTEEYLQDYNGDNAFYEDKTIKVVVQTDLTDSSSDSSDQEQEQLGGNLLDILNWVRPLPPLLSPVRFSPPAMQDTLFGESTDSSDEEIDHNAHIVESILEGKGESQSNCNFVSVKESNEHEKPHKPNDREISTKLRENEETSIYIDTFSAKSSYVKEKDAEGKQTEMTVSSMNILAREEHSEEDSENIGPEERERTVKVATPKLEAINEKEVHIDQIHSAEEVLSSTCMSSSFQYLQEKSSELVPTEKTIATNLNTTVNSEHMKEKSSKLMEAEEAEIPRKVETPKPASTLRDGVHLQTGEPIFATESILVTLENFEEEHRESMGNEAMENESSDIQTKSNVVNTTLCIEKHVEKVETAQGQVIATVITEGFCVETNNEPRHNEEGDVRSSFSNSKSCFGAEHDSELVCQCNSDRMLMQTEIDTEAKDISTKSQCSELKFSNEETLDKQCERTKQHGVNEEGGLESNNTFRHDSFVLATERNRDSLYIDGENHIAKVCKIAHSMSAKGGDGEQLRTGEQCVEVNLTQPEQKVFTGSSANQEDFLETCRFAKSLHVMEVGKLLDAKEERYLQAKLDHEQKDASKLLQKKLDFETTLTSPNPTFDINGENDPLESEEIVKTNHVLLAPEHVTEKASEMRQAKNTFIASEHRSPKFQNCIEVFEPQGIEMEMDHSEIRERRSGPLETEKINTVKSVITESEHASWAQFLKHVNSCSITEISQCDKIRETLNDKPCEAVAINNCNNSPDLEENGVEEVEMRNQISDDTGQVVSEENAIEEPALSIEDVLETGSIDTEEINTPVTVAVGLERTAVPTDLTAFNLQVCDEPVKQNCQAFDTNSVDFVTALSTASALTRGNEKCNDHVIQSMPNYSLGNLLTIHDKEKIKPLECLSNKYENKNRAENEKEQPSAKEPQKTLVNTQFLGASSFDSGTHTKKEASLVFEEAECETCSWKEIITERIVLKETSPHRVDHLWSSEGQVRRPTEDRSDETIKDKGKELNIKLCEEKNGNKTSENTSEVPEERDESEEDIPFRKVKYTKQHEPFLASTEKLRTFRTYTVDVPAICTAVDENNDQMCELPPSGYSDALADMAIPCVTNHSPSIVKELSCLTKKVCLKDKLFTTHGTIFHNDENNERASEHRENSKIIGSVSDKENSLIKLEELSISAEVSEKIPTKQTTSEINVLPHQMLAKCSEIYKNAIKNSKLDTGMSGNFLQINRDEKLASNMEQSVSCDAGIEVSKAHKVFCEELNDKEEETHAAFASADINTNIAQDGCQSCYDGNCSDAFLNEIGFQRKDKENSFKNYQHPPLSHEISDPKPVSQTSEQKAVFENAYAVESESSVDLISKNNHRSDWKVQELSNVLNVSAKALIQAGQSRLTQRLPRGKEKTKTSQVQVTQPVLANADTSTPTKRSSETINKIRQEMGPPLPPLLLPLIATPPRTLRPVSPIMSSSSRSSLPSPLDDLISPLRDTPLPPLMSPLSDAPKYKSPRIFSTPSPSETAVGQRILSSPLQFCAATPKHALPVPGRLPPSAAGSAASDVSQENSVKILDSMYPELSARARTLNILKGNIQPNRCAPSESKNVPGPVSQFSGFKAISSTSTAFVKTGSNSESHCSKDQKDSGCQSHVGKRTLSASMPRSAKRLRLDSESPQFETKEDVAIKAVGDFNIEVQSAAGKTLSLNNCEIRQLAELPSPVEENIDPVALALKKIAESCFDLLPVIRSHVYVGNISKVPVMRDEEKEVVCEFGITNKHLAKPLLRAILSKLKTQKMSLNHNFTQALCRVYVGICRQLGDLERARLFCYSLLKEDFPQSAKLTLFITNVWDDIFSFQGVINKAMQLIARQRARGEVLHCLSAYLSWEKSPPLDAGIMVSSLLLAIQLYPKMEFQLSEQYGEDLSESTWECILAIDLLCSHLKWGWTHDNIISKELWPVMDKWVKHRKGHETIPSTPDIIVASTLRLIGRLCQIGLKEGFFSAVKNISFVIGRFIQHAKEEDVPWGVQLAAVYALCDLGPSNPVGVIEAIRAWRTAITNSIPAAVTSGIAEVSSLCTAELHSDEGK